jgi:hypothetical protein
MNDVLRKLNTGLLLDYLRRFRYYDVFTKTELPCAKAERLNEVSAERIVTVDQIVVSRQSSANVELLKAGCPFAINAGLFLRFLASMVNGGEPAGDKLSGLFGWEGRARAL